MTKKSSNTDQINIAVISEIRKLEIKWLRPFREGDLATADGIKQQIIDLRTQLVRE